MANKASLNPNEHMEGGGLIDDVDATIKEARFILFDYAGTLPDGQPSMRLSLEADGDLFTEHYGCGNKNDWTPADDGKSLLQVGTASGLRKSTDAHIFLKSLIDNGFPDDKLGDDISVLDGLECHIVRIPKPERKGVKKSKKQIEREEKYGPPTMVVVSSVNKLPWEKATPKGAKKAASAKKGKAKADAPNRDDAINAKAIEVILGILAENGTVEQKKLPGLIFAAMKDDPDRNAVLQFSVKPENLETDAWSFEDGVLSLG